MEQNSILFLFAVTILHSQSLSLERLTEFVITLEHKWSMPCKSCIYWVFLESLSWHSSCFVVWHERASPVHERLKLGEMSRFREE